MADNVAITAGAGTTIATDDVAGVQYQRVKLALGADGAAADAPIGAGVEAGVLRVTLPTDGTGVVSAALLGAVNETAPATDTASSGLNGRLQRIAQRLTTLLAGGLPAALGAGGGVKVDGSGTALPVSGTVTANLAAGTNNIGDVDVLSVVPGTGATNLGKAEDAAHTTGDTGVMPLAVRKDTPTALAGTDGDYAPLEVDSVGRMHVLDALPHVGLIAAGLTAKTAQWTTAQTGIALWTPAAGKKIVVTKVQIQAGGTVAGTVQLWFGAAADTTYTRGTDLAIFDGEFAPSATLKPGVVLDGPFISGTADHILRVTDSAAINPLTVTVWGYEVT